VSHAFGDILGNKPRAPSFEGLVLSICYQKVVPKVHLQTMLKAAYANRDMIELEFRI